MEQKNEIEVTEINEAIDSSVADGGHSAQQVQDTSAQQVQDTSAQQVQNTSAPQGQDTSAQHSQHTSAHRHSSHSHSSHSHRSSRSRRRRKNDDSSLLDRIQRYIDKKLGKKTVKAISISLLAAIVVLIGVIYFVETDYGKNIIYNGSWGDLNPGQFGQSSNNSDSQTSTVAWIPSYWENEVAEKTNNVKTLQTAGGKDCVSFVWVSDTHIPDNSTARTNDIGKVMAKMMDNCDIPFAVLTGDIGTRASYATEEEFVRSHEMIPEHLAPLWGSERLLVAVGNHDGCYGDSSGYYKKQFTPERMWQLYFRKQALDPRRVFSDDGSYFYVDNEAQKVRFIVLNSHFGGEYLSDGNGWAVNDRFAVSCYGQEQLDWLADVALDMPEGYGAIVTAHVPPKNLSETAAEPYTVDCAQLRGIIDAYNTRSKFSGSYENGVDGWTNSRIDVDFSDAKGEVIAMFTGHIHCDTVDTTTMSCPIITIISAGASVNMGENPERIFGTDSETSFDVVTINRKTRTIYCTRVGAGEDRTIKY